MEDVDRLHESEQYAWLNADVKVQVMYNALKHLNGKKTEGEKKP